jgi:CHAD domain-containing protein
MSLRLKESEPLEPALRRLALECIDLALAALEGTDGYDAMIHTVRKQTKQLRSLLRLFRSGMGLECVQEQRFFRDLARRVSAARDGAVALDVHRALISEFGSGLDASVGASVRQALIADLQAAMRRSGSSPGHHPVHEGLRAQLLAARSRCRHLRLAQTSDRVLERGLSRSYRRARKAIMQAAHSHSADDLHELRKLAKDYFYQLEFVARRWPDLNLRQTARVRTLTQLLGDGQDLVVYCAAISGAASRRCPEAFEILQALAESRRRELNSRALDLALEIFSPKPKQLLAGMGETGSLSRAAG